MFGLCVDWWSLSECDLDLGLGLCLGLALGLGSPN